MHCSLNISDYTTELIYIIKCTKNNNVQHLQNIFCSALSLNPKRMKICVQSYMYTYTVYKAPEFKVVKVIFYDKFIVY